MHRLQLCRDAQSTHTAICLAVYSGEMIAAAQPAKGAAQRGALYEPGMATGIHGNSAACMGRNSLCAMDFVDSLKFTWGIDCTFVSVAFAAVGKNACLIMDGASCSHCNRAAGSQLKCPNQTLDCCFTETVKL